MENSYTYQLYPADPKQLGFPNNLGWLTTLTASIVRVEIQGHNTE